MRSGESSPHPVEMTNSGRGMRGMQGLDRRPADTTLAIYFAGLSLRHLAGCWVACIVDEMIEAKHFGQALDLSGINRALCVVAERLHGVTFTENVMAHGHPPLGPVDPARPKATPVGDQAKPSIEVFTTEAPPPVKAPSKTAGAFAPIVDRISKSVPGAWTAVPESVGKFRGLAMSLAAMRRHKHPGAAMCEFYKDHQGRSILKRKQ